MTIIKCARCNKELTKSDRTWAEKTKYARCAECLYHENNGTDTIEKYNEWLKKK